MKTVIRGFLVAGTIALGTIGGLASASADVIRVGFAIAANADDQAVNVEVSKKLWEIMKKAQGIKEFHGIQDDKAMATGTVSVWASPADYDAIGNSDEWKALIGQLKVKERVVQILEIAE